MSGGGEGASKTEVTADQVSALQLLVTEQKAELVRQKALLDQQKAAFDAVVAQRKVEEAAALLVKQEVDQLKADFAVHQSGSHGGGRGGGGGGSGRGGHNPVVSSFSQVPVNAIKMDPCPSATKEQSMREWTTLAKRWARCLPDKLTVGEGRYRAHTAIAAGLNGKPRVKTAWTRVLEPYERRYDDEGVAFPTLNVMLKELKENVVEEEKVVAQEEFKFRDMSAEESYSEYKMALFALAGVGYDEYSEDQLAAKVLERFLAGCGEAGPSVRLQAPKSLEEAITKAIAFDNEKTRTEKATVYAFGNTNNRQKGNNSSRYNNNNNNRGIPFRGTCFICKKRGHKSVDCWSRNNNNNNNDNNNESGNSNNNNGSNNSNNHNDNNQKPAPRCFVCNSTEHRAFQCPNRADRQ